MNKELKGTLIIVGMVIIISIVTFLFLTLLEEQSTETRTVDATGFADVSHTPDYGVISFRIESTANTSSEAGRLHSIKSVNVEKELQYRGINNPIVKNYRLIEEFTWNHGTRKSTGFKAISYLEVKTDQIYKIGRFIDAGIQGGALIDSIYYEMEDISQLKIQALEQASTDARNRAQAILRGVGEDIGELVSISTDYNYRPYSIYEGGMMKDDEITSSAILDLNPQDVEVSATVYVTYTIK